MIGDDQMTADSAYRLACEGTAILWRGDFQNARQLLQAMARRIDNKPRKAQRRPQRHRRLRPSTPSICIGSRSRSAPARSAMLLLPLDEQYAIPLRRAPDVRDACEEAYGPSDGPSVVSLREVLGLIGAHEWRKKGVEIPALGARIHPYYGVFSPVRGEYIELVADAAAAVEVARVRYRHRHRRARGAAGAARRRARRRDRYGSARARLRAREHRAARARQCRST